MLGASGKKYDRTIFGKYGGSTIVDVYRVLVAFAVTCQARGHAIKKLLCAGLRGKGDEFSDVVEAIDAAIESAAIIADTTDAILQPSKLQRLMILRNAEKLFELSDAAGLSVDKEAEKEALSNLAILVFEMKVAGEPKRTEAAQERGGLLPN